MMHDDDNDTYTNDNGGCDHLTGDEYCKHENESQSDLRVEPSIDLRQLPLARSLCVRLGTIKVLCDLIECCFVRPSQFCKGQWSDEAMLC